MSSQEANEIGEGIHISLQEWITVVRQKQIQQSPVGVERNQCWQDTLLGATTVAYGVVELLRCDRSHPQSTPSAVRNGPRLILANFAVRSNRSGKDVWGVAMRDPPLTLSLVEPSFLCDDNDNREEEPRGRYLEAELVAAPPGEKPSAAAIAVSQSEEDARCRSLGSFLHELFSHIAPLSNDGPPEGLHGGSRPPAQKIRRLNLTASEEGKHLPSAAFQPERYVPLAELGHPSSIDMLVRNLLECRADDRPDDAYDSLDIVSKDLHLLLLDPFRFLFDREVPPHGNGVPMSFREHTLYGREREVSLITDAFCRVSTGRCEALLVAGFSGSGKSRLVRSLTARVDVAEGYVLSHKFEEMSQKRPLWEVVSVFNDLCRLIKEKRTPQNLRVVSDQLAHVFEADFSLLAQLIPNVHVLSPRKFTERETSNDARMNYRSICFILQRFLGVVSSTSHPVMFFLDDIQWADKSALALIEDMLRDANGSRCFFFVGAYRSNEVSDDHHIFSLIDRLDSAGVPITELNLEGLAPGDLNAMISDATGLFPRISEPLSDIVFQKTKGNPFFVLQFLQLLLDRKIMKYSAHQGRWTWDEDRVSSMDVMGNVVSLLSSKMAGLPKNMQVALKAMSCFGIKIKESIVDYLDSLGSKVEYVGIRARLEQAVSKGYMLKVGKELKFAHDKIRELWSLI